MFLKNYKYLLGTLRINYNINWCNYAYHSFNNNIIIYYFKYIYVICKSLNINNIFI